MDAVVSGASSLKTDISAKLKRDINPDTGLDAAISNACSALLAQQNIEGYWCYELEADCTIPAEYILMMHYMGEVDEILQTKIAKYLRAHQQTNGGFQLYPQGPFDLSCTVKVYYALKLAGDDPKAPHMRKACELIRTHGGAARANVFTRIMLAMFEQVPWRAAPVVPVELMLLPRWSPFHISKISYWSRAVVVPLTILCSLKASAKNPLAIDIQELFVSDPDKVNDYFPKNTLLNRAFIIADSVLRIMEPIIPRWIRGRAVRKAETWFVERLNGEGGLGAIFPAMVNAYQALDLLGYKADHPLRITAKKAIDDLMVVNDDSAYCQPCNSPVWDTALACLALQEVGHDDTQQFTHRALDWLKSKQLLDEDGDWRDDHPQLEGGGWPFQFRNDFYPDLDDTSVVAWSMCNANQPRYSESIRRAANWLHGMQSKNGGFASFDSDNQYEYLNQIPFADHGALLDPPTVDVSARCIMVFSKIDQGDGHFEKAINKCLTYLRKEQEESGAWFGRWGTNYIYGTWAVLASLEQIGIRNDDPMIQKAVRWLKSKQRIDGGWGESNNSYFDPNTAGEDKISTSFQTAWAMLALMAAGEGTSPELRRAAAYLIRTQHEDYLWHDEVFTAPGFPRVFHLKYHGYDKIFPLWALARYRNLKQLKSK